MGNKKKKIFSIFDDLAKITKAKSRKKELEDLVGAGKKKNIINQGADALGDKVIKFVGLPKKAYEGSKKGGAKALADPKEVKGEVKAQADEVITGVARGADKDKTIGETAESLSDSLEKGLTNIGKRFKRDFDSLDLSHQGNIPLGQINKLWDKLNLEQGGAVLNGKGQLIRNTIATDIGVIIKRARQGKTTVSKAIRKIRSLAGRMHHDNQSKFGAGEAKLKYADETLAEFNEAIRKVFDEHVKRVGNFKKDTAFIKRARKTDKDYSEHFDIKNNKQISNASKFASKAQSQLDTKVNNPDKALNHFNEYLVEMKKMGKAMDNPNFVKEQTDVYRDALSARLFKEDSPLFGKYMTSKDGMKLMKKMWPDQAKAIDGFSIMYKRANKLHGSVAAWGSKVMGMALIGGGAGGAVVTGTLLGSGVGAALTFAASSAIMAGVKTPAFQRFVLRQLGKKPEAPKKALQRLTKLLRGNQDMAQKIIDTFPRAVGYTTAGGMALGAYELTKPSQSEKDIEFDKMFGVKKKYKVDKSFDKMFGIIPE